MMMDPVVGRRLFASESAAMFCYWIIWPFEVLKNWLKLRLSKLETIHLKGLNS